jgi:hypothetical protein
LGVLGGSEWEFRRFLRTDVNGPVIMVVMTTADAIMYVSVVEGDTGGGVGVDAVGDVVEEGGGVVFGGNVVCCVEMTVKVTVFEVVVVPFASVTRQ